jgi:hypothetical protein
VYGRWSLDRVTLAQTYDRAMLGQMSEDGMRVTKGLGWSRIYIYMSRLRSKYGDERVCPHCSTEGEAESMTPMHGTCKITLVWRSRTWIDVNDRLEADARYLAGAVKSRLNDTYPYSSLNTHPISSHVVPSTYYDLYVHCPLTAQTIHLCM